MRDQNVAITKDEAELIFKVPTTNIINVSTEQELRILQYIIKNALLHFEKVELRATGKAVANAVDAAKNLEVEGACDLDKVQTGLEGEKKAYVARILVVVARKKK